MSADLCLLLIAFGITAYAILGGADFGAGFWDLTAGGDRRGGPIRGLVERSMSPVWEANHVWLIFILVTLWTAFPVAFASIMSTLALPMALAVLGIVLRGTAFALRGVAGTISEARLLGALFALSSVIVPFCLGASVGAVASGRVPVGNAAGDPITSWLNPTSIAIGALAVSSSAYIAAVFLAADARRSGLENLIPGLRRRAIGSALAAGAIAVLALAVVQLDVPDLFEGLVRGPGLLGVATSVAAGCLALALVWNRRFALARWVSAVAVGSVTVGWFLAQRPELLPGSLTVAEGAAPESTLIAVLACTVLGLAILIPCLVLLFRMTLRGRLDKDFQPIDHRYRRKSRSEGART